MAQQPSQAERRRGLEQLVLAYRLGADGQAAAADHEFRGVIAQLEAWGDSWRQDLSFGAPTLAAGSHANGLSIPAVGTLFFDAATWKPLKLEPGLELWGAAPQLVGDYFATQALGELSSLYPLSGGTAQSIEDVVALHPDGTRAFSLGEDCFIRMWDLRTGKQAARFGPYRAKQQERRCDRDDFGTSAVRFDGRALVSIWGTWDLSTGKRGRLPIPQVTLDVLRPAVDPTGRYAVYGWLNPKAANPHGFDSSWIKLLDLRTGAITRQPVGLLSNWRALTFLEDPLRVCVVDYGNRAFSVPALEPLPSAKRAPDEGCSVDGSGVAAPPSALLRRAYREVCSLGGLPIPSRYCPR